MSFMDDVSEKDMIEAVQKAGYRVINVPMVLLPIEGVIEYELSGKPNMQFGKLTELPKAFEKICRADRIINEFS